MVFFTQSQKILAGVETEPGTEQSSLNTMMVNNVSDLTHQITAPERRLADGSHGFSYGPRPRPSFTTCTIGGVLIPVNTLGTPPSVSPLLQACGLSEVATIDTDVVYTPISTGHKAVTIKVQEDGQTHKLIGAMGNLQINWEVGGALQFQAAMTGHYTAPVAEALSVNSVSRSPVPMIASAESVAMVDVFGATDVHIQSFSLDMGNRMFARDLAGGKIVRITDRGVTGTIVVKAPTLADKNYFTQLTTLAPFSNGSLSWQINDNGATPDILFECSDTAQLIDVQHRDIDGIRFYALSFRLVHADGGDGEFTITLA